MTRTSSVVVKVIAWYDWLLVVLVLMLGAYTCKCLDYFLKVGVQNALLVPAKEAGNIFETTGSHLSGSPKDALAMPISTSCEPKVLLSSMSGAPPAMRDARLLITTARSKFGDRGYLLEAGTPKRAIRAVFRETAVTMLSGLLVGLILATLGGFVLVKRALVPIEKIAQAVEDLPMHCPEEPSQRGDVPEKIRGLCFVVNELIRQLEASFGIGIGLPAEAFQTPRNRLGAMRAEATLFENERPSSGIAKSLLRLLKESERLSAISRDLERPSGKDAGQSAADRLKFYFGRLAANGMEHVSVLSKKLGTDLTCQVRGSGTGNAVQW
jgi:hypothetical protein